MASRSNDETKTWENIKVTSDEFDNWTMVHEIKVNGCHLVEREECKIVDQMPIRIHSYSIDDRSYTVQSSGRFDRNFKVETQMTQSEVERFNEDWRNLWNPQTKAEMPHF